MIVLLAMSDLDFLEMVIVDTINAIIYFKS